MGCRGKLGKFPLPLLFLLASKRKAFVCDPRHSIKVLVVFGDAPNKLFVSGVS